MSVNSMFAGVVEFCFLIVTFGETQRTWTALTGIFSVSLTCGMGMILDEREKMKTINLLAFATTIIVLASCAYMPYAREAKKRPRQGGVISLKTDHRAEDQAKAQAMMAANCGSNATPKVLEEGEVVVGERSNTTADQTNEQVRTAGLNLGGGFSLGGKNKPSQRTSTVSEITQIKEWQIVYVCETEKRG